MHCNFLSLLMLLICISQFEPDSCRFESGYEYKFESKDLNLTRVCCCKMMAFSLLIFYVRVCVSSVNCWCYMHCSCECIVIGCVVFVMQSLLFMNCCCQMLEWFTVGSLCRPGSLVSKAFRTMPLNSSHTLLRLVISWSLLFFIPY